MIYVTTMDNKEMRYLRVTGILSYWNNFSGCIWMGENFKKFNHIDSKKGSSECIPDIEFDK